MTSFGPEWHHLNLPAEYEAKRGCRCPDCVSGETFLGFRDPRTTEGESLHPARLTEAVLAAERARPGFNYAGQMQQRPAPEEGGLFKREFLKVVERRDVPALREVALSLDACMKAKAEREKGSRSALLAIGCAAHERYVIDAWARAEELPATNQAIREMTARVLENHGARVTKLLVETAALGPAVIQTMREELRALNIPIIEVQPRGDKIVGKQAGQRTGGDDKYSRAHAVVPIVESNNVRLVRAAWTDDVLAELTVFPNGARDDYVDAFSQALTALRKSSAAMAFLATTSKRV